MKNIFFIAAYLCVSFFELSAQSVSFPDDQQERGYYNRPYKRYEAEPGKCISNAFFLPRTYRSCLKSKIS